MNQPSRKDVRTQELDKLKSYTYLTTPVKPGTLVMINGKALGSTTLVVAK